MKQQTEKHIHIEETDNFKTKFKNNDSLESQALDNLLTNNNGITGANLEYVGGGSTELDFDDLDTVLTRNVLSRTNINPNVGTNFISETTTVGITMGELLNVISPVTMKVDEYQRELRQVGKKDIAIIHRTVCETGQTDLVPFCFVEIAGLIVGLEVRTEELQRTGEDEDLLELLTERLDRYRGYVDGHDPFRYFVLDGQTRLDTYQQYYSAKSRAKILYDNHSLDKFHVIHDGAIEDFSPHGRMFSSLSLARKRAFWDTLPIDIKIIVTKDFKSPATAFSIVNGGLPVRNSLTAMNCSFNGLRNQVEKLNLREDSEEYPQLIENKHDVLQKYFYKGSSSALFSKSSRGQHAFTYLELVHLRGDQIENDETAKEMYKNGVLFAEGQSNGFDGILKILDNPIAVASKRAFEDVQYIRNGLAQAMDQLDSDDELFGYETSSKVNGVYFTRKIEDLEYSKYDWKELFIAYLRWNTQLRIDTHWEKVDETIVAREPTRYSQKDIDNKVNYHCLVKKGNVENNKDYYFWGRDQYTAVNITKRMNAIQDFIDNNIEEWKKEGYIA